MNLNAIIDRWLSVIDRLVGVVDLKAGMAVHGIGGRRDEYQPVKVPGPMILPSVADGVSDNQTTSGERSNATQLVAWYRAIGIRKFYLADLDALSGKPMQCHAVETLLDDSASNESWLLDLGLCEKTAVCDWSWVQACANSSRTARFILTSECATSLGVIEQAAKSLPLDQLVLGVDFKSGRFIGPQQSTASDWVREGKRLGICRGLALDVADVGSRSGFRADSPVSTCVSDFSDFQWVSGGGCRGPADVRKILDQGCSDCLIATALLPDVVA